MTQKERLVELIKDEIDCDKAGIIPEWLADYLIANGVIATPCKVGDTVYLIEKNCYECQHFSSSYFSDSVECKLDDNKLMFECDFDADCIYEIVKDKFRYSYMDGNSFGKTVFLTREEAEKALAETTDKNLQE